MKILITGGAGFIGSTFVRMMFRGLLPNLENFQMVTVFDSLSIGGSLKNLSPVKDDSRFRFVKGDIRDVALLNKEIKGNEFVIHFAAQSHVDRSLKDPLQFFEVNAIGTSNVLQASLQQQVQKVLHISTDEVYGSINHGSWDENSPMLPNSPYAASKACSDLIALSYYKTYGLNVNITRCSNNYGPNQFVEKAIPLFITNLLSKKKIPIYGDGQHSRDWLYVEDHCRAIAKVLTEGSPGQIYNIGGGLELRNLELANRIISKLNLDSDAIEFVEDRLAHDKRYSLNFDKISFNLGYAPQVAFEDGLATTINWYRDNFEFWNTND
jgi:dTDP-glucose 4,6-dehydratase